MAIPYEVRSVPGKGMGMFATIAVLPGSAILHENYTMNIATQAGQLAEADIQDACNLLNVAEQEQFLSLHSSNKFPRYSLIYKIYRANSFETGGLCTLLLGISRVNHSCHPNAIVQFSDAQQHASLVARKPIAEGEEISITYKERDLASMVTYTRQRVLAHTHGFWCICRLCQKMGSPATLSNMRRQLINGLYQPLSGLQPFGHNSTTDAPGGLWEPARISEPLTLWKRTMYYLLLANAQEAEGIDSIMTSQSYVSAAYCLLGQASRAGNDVIVLQVARHVRELMRKAIWLESSARGEVWWEHWLHGSSKWPNKRP
ncbi:hypothetical protein LTR17_022601 [Elasticomyces elasticus]|nr:hypothetical protein LTR17_022601 [Elasticomyces elasticus]